MTGFEDLEPVTPEQRALLLRMGIARRIGPYVVGDAERIAEVLADQLLADLDGIGFVLIIAWDRSEPT
jgi:hypothetical protein